MAETPPQASWLGRIGETYNMLWKMVIRPPRDLYSPDELGPLKFRLGRESMSAETCSSKAAAVFYSAVILSLPGIQKQDGHVLCTSTETAHLGWKLSTLCLSSFRVT